MSGLKGCFMPDTCFSTDTLLDGAEAFACIFEIEVKDILYAVGPTGGSMDLDNTTFGAETLSITECSCDDPDSHNDN